MKLPQNGAASKPAFDGSEGSQFSRKLIIINDNISSLVLFLFPPSPFSLCTSLK